MKGFLVFPPIHDFAMPYLAGPLLKGYIEQCDPDIRVTCIDLNHTFFKRAIEKYSSLLDRYRSSFESSSVSESVGGAITYQSQALDELKKFSNKNQGHGWSLRNYKAPFNRIIFSECIEYSKGNKPYDQLYIEFFDN